MNAIPFPVKTCDYVSSIPWAKLKVSLAELSDKVLVLITDNGRIGSLASSLITLSCHVNESVFRTWTPVLAHAWHVPPWSMQN